jgi:hypothetical protein
MIASAFSDASTRFPEVIFGGINCDAYRRLCDVSAPLPLVRFYPARNQTEPIDFSEEPQNSESYVEFIERQTHFKARPSVQGRDIELDPVLWPRRLRNNTCGAVMFCARQLSECNHLRPQFQFLAFVFEGDPNITIGVVDCDESPRLCQHGGATYYPEDEYEDGPSPWPPDVRLWIRGKWENYTKGLGPQLLIANINRKCGTDRAHTGLLSDTAGRIEAADRLAQTFLGSENKEQAIEEAKKIPGAEFYVKAMERVKAGGVEKLKTDLRSMKRIMRDRQGSLVALDAMKKRYNIMLQFLPKNTGKSSDQPKANESEL